MNTKEKILKYLDYKGISKREFYLKTGLSNGFLDSGKHIGTDKAEIIISKFPDLSLEWLVLNKGDMIITKSEKNLTLSGGYSNTKSEKNITLSNGKKNGKDLPKNEKRTKYYPLADDDEQHLATETIRNFGLSTDNRIVKQDIPLYNIEATAGLVPLFSDTKEQTPVDFINIPNLPRCDGAIYVTGDSMYPLLKSGDIVLYKQINDVAANIFWGEMYLISIDIEGEEYVTVKYIQKSDNPDNIRLVSYNQHHSDKDVHISKIRALAFVKASIRMNSMK